MNAARTRLEAFLEDATGPDLLRELRSEWLIGLFPGIDRIIGCVQGIENHAEGDVATHTVLVFENLLRVCRDDLGRDADFIERMAALIHDWKKPDSRVEREDGTICFPGHEEMARCQLNAVAKSLELSELEIAKLRFLVGEHGNAHGFESLSHARKSFLRRDPNIESLCVLQKADALSCHCIGGGHLPVLWQAMMSDEHI